MLKVDTTLSQYVLHLETRRSTAPLPPPPISDDTGIHTRSTQRKDITFSVQSLYKAKHMAGFWMLRYKVYNYSAKNSEFTYCNNMTTVYPEMRQREALQCSKCHGGLAFCSKILHKTIKFMAGIVISLQLYGSFARKATSAYSMKKPLSALFRRL